MDEQPAPPAEAVGTTDVAGSLKLQIERVLDDMESLGIVTELAEKVVGGVALSASYYQHALATEGRTDQVPACQLLITRRKEQDLALLPATQAELQEGRYHLPRESALLSKMMSPAALSELHWTRVPAVVIFGCFMADQEELAEAAAAGIPVSPSLSGPHPEEQLTQMEVFLKQYKYPEHKCFLLRDWGFVICASDLLDAMASFDDRLKETLVLSAEAGDTLSEGDESMQHSQRSSAHGGITSSSDSKPAAGGLAGAFKRLQARVGLLRTQSEPPPEELAAAAGLVRSPKEGSKAQFGGMSEPSSPMIGSEVLPDSIRNISVVGRRQSSECRVPSIHAGMRPW